MKKLNLEYYYQGESLEHLTITAPNFIIPQVGDLIYIEFTNNNYNKDPGMNWIVIERKILNLRLKPDFLKDAHDSYDDKHYYQTIQCNIIPHSGLFKTDPLYEREQSEVNAKIKE